MICKGIHSIIHPGLDKELVPFLVREPDDFGLDAGAVPGTHAGDGAVIHGAAVQVFPDDLVGLFVGIGQVADSRIVHLVAGLEGEWLHPVIAGLQLHLGEIDAAAVDPGGRAGLEPAQRKAKLP